MESEESWRQDSDLTNRNHIRPQLRIRLLHKLKSNNYSGLTVVNVADTWSERLRSYLGRSRQRMELHQQMHMKFVATTNGEKSAEVIVPFTASTGVVVTIKMVMSSIKSSVKRMYRKGLYRWGIPHVGQAQDPQAIIFPFQYDPEIF